MQRWIFRSAPHRMSPGSGTTASTPPSTDLPTRRTSLLDSGGRTARRVIRSGRLEATARASLDSAATGAVTTGSSIPSLVRRTVPRVIRSDPPSRSWAPAASTPSLIELRLAARTAAST